jgi:hypothetical protein
VVVARRESHPVREGGEVPPGEGGRGALEASSPMAHLGRWRLPPPRDAGAPPLQPPAGLGSAGSGHHAVGLGGALRSAARAVAELGSHLQWGSGSVAAWERFAGESLMRSRLRRRREAEKRRARRRAWWGALEMVTFAVLGAAALFVGAWLLWALGA